MPSGKKVGTGVFAEIHTMLDLALSGRFELTGEKVSSVVRGETRIIGDLGNLCPFVAIESKGVNGKFTGVFVSRQELVSLSSLAEKASEGDELTAKIAKRELDRLGIPVFVSSKDDFSVITGFGSGEKRFPISVKSSKMGQPTIINASGAGSLEFELGASDTGVLEECLIMMKDDSGVPRQEQGVSNWRDMAFRNRVSLRFSGKKTSDLSRNLSSWRSGRALRFLAFCMERFHSGNDSAISLEAYGEMYRKLSHEADESMSDLSDLLLLSFDKWTPQQPIPSVLSENSVVCHVSHGGVSYLKTSKLKENILAEMTIEQPEYKRRRGFDLRQENGRFYASIPVQIRKMSGGTMVV